MSQYPEHKLLYVPTMEKVTHKQAVVSLDSVIQWHKNGLYGAWKTIDTSSYAELRAMLFETFTIEKSVFMKFTDDDDDDDLEECLHRDHMFPYRLKQGEKCSTISTIVG